jgi:O-antigen ligase
LWVFVFCLPWENMVMLPAIGTIARTTGLVAAAICLVVIALRGILHINSFAILTSIYFTLASLSILWSPYPDEAFQSIKTDLQLLALVFIVHQFTHTSAHVRAFFTAYVLGSCVIALDTIRMFWIAPEMDLMYRRFVASGFNENDGAFIMALAIPMAWHVALSAKRWFQRCILAYLPVGFYGIMLTGSRSGFVAAIIALSAPFFHVGGLSSSAKAAVMLGLVPMTFVLFLWIVDSMVPEDTLARIGTLAVGQAEDDEGGLSGRIPIWMKGIDLFARNPLIGTGAGTFNEAMAALYGHGKAAHNGFVATAVELGVIGLVVFVLVLMRLAKDVRAAPVADRRTWYVLLAVLLIPLMTGSWVWFKQTWLLFALATAHAEEATQRSRNAPDAGFFIGAADRRRRGGYLQPNGK